MQFVLLYTLILCTAACHSPPSPPDLETLILQGDHCHGQDILGLARQDVEMISNNWAQGECLGVLAGTFGPTIKPVRQIVEKNNVPAVRWHLSFCNHNNQCGPGECQPTDLNCMKKKAKDINDLHVIYPQTVCYISPRLEYTERNCTKVNSWFNAVKNSAPLCKLIASPMPGSCIPNDVLIEKHGNTPGEADSVSNDGANYFDSDSVKYNKLGKLFNFKWTYRNNLRLSSEKGSVPPPMKRSISNRLGLKDLKQMQLMKENLSAMPYPLFCEDIRSLQNNEIWKNHAEDYNQGDRSNKPLLIYRSKRDKLSIYDSSGKKIACMKYYGPFENLYRLYVGSCSGDHAVDLYKKAGDWVFVKDGSTCIGLPSIRRWGKFR